MWKTCEARRLRRTPRGDRVEGVTGGVRDDTDCAAGSGLICFGPVQVDQEALVGGDDVGDVEAVQVVGAQRAFPTDQ